MAQTDIDHMVAAYGKGAASAKGLDCDSVEIQAAQGYLIDQFFWAGINLRTDS